VVEQIAATAEEPSQEGPSGASSPWLEPELGKISCDFIFVLQTSGN